MTILTTYQSRTTKEERYDDSIQNRYQVDKNSHDTVDFLEDCLDSINKTAKVHILVNDNVTVEHTLRDDFTDMRRLLVMLDGPSTM
eukprot:3584423-Amphidinium_carterae.1